MFTASMPVMTRNGVRGLIRPENWQAGAAQGEIIIHFADGNQIVVPMATLEPRPDGGYWVNLTAQELDALVPSFSARQANDTSSADELVIPVLNEEAQVRIERTPIATVRVQKMVEHRNETVQTSLVDEQVKVERRPMNQVVEELPTVRHEGDTMIIPVVEERLIVQKQYVLTEEIHITTTRHTQHTNQTFTLRREAVSVERIPFSSTTVSDTSNTTQQGERS